MTRGKWTAERVLEAIRSRHERGLSLTSVWKEDKSLHFAAWQHFGSWQNAIVTAGFKRTQRKWSREQVIESLRAWHQKGVPMIKLTALDGPLCSAAFHYFANLREALLAAGIQPPPPKTWTQQRVIESLRSWHEQGRRIKSLWRERPTLCAAMWRLFGSQDAALKAAGIAEGQMWDPQRVIEEIRARHVRGLPLSGNSVPGPLTCAANRHFGGWNSALRAAGFLPKRTRRGSYPKLSKGNLLRQIQLLQRSGLSLKRKDNPRLANAAYRHFGTWTKALQAAGVDCQPRRTWTHEIVIDQLREWDAEGRFEHSTKTEDRTFYYAATRLFGSWPAALHAANVLAPGERARRGSQWSRRRIIELLQDRHVRGVPITYERDNRLIAAAIVRFGSWYEARRAAGVPTGRVSPRKRWTAQAVIKEILLRREGKRKIVNTDREDRRLTSAARRYFGCWHEALVAAGVVSREATRRVPQKWSRQRVVEELQARHRAGLPLVNGCPSNRLLVNAAYRYFGSLPAALAAAKIPGDHKPRRKWSRQRVLDEIRTRYERRLPLGKAAVGSSVYCAALRRFGSWHNALVAAGVVHTKAKPNRQIWSQQRVVDEIRSRYREGLPLSCHAPHNRLLAPAAERHFGRWTHALTAAGIPGSYGPRQRWTRERVVEELRARSRPGVPLTHRRAGSALASAARRFFGSWFRALDAAGIAKKE